MRRTIARAIVLYAAVNVVLSVREHGVRDAVHNLVAHPLLVLSPQLGEGLHGATAPVEDHRPG